MVDNLTVIEKSEVTVPAPGGMIHALKKQPSGNVSLPNQDRRTAAGIYYEMYRKHPWVRAVVDKIAKNAAAPGISFVASDPEKTVVKLHRSSLVDFFRKSHSKKLLRATYKDILIFGEAFWWVDVTAGGKPLMAKRLIPEYVDAVLNEAGDEVESWRYGPFSQDQDAIYYSASNILHFAMEDPHDDVVGLSPLDSLTDTVSQDLFAMRFNRSFYENSAQTGLIFNMTNATGDEVARNRAWLEANYVGAQNAHRPILLEGDINIQHSVANSQEMDFIAGRELNRAEIFGVFDMPPSKVGITDTANRSVAKEADNTYHEETINPLQNLVEEEVNDKLILELFGWDDILFQHEESTGRAKLAQLQIYKTGVDDGLLSRNEVRQELGRGKIEGGDVVTISTSAGVVPLERLLEEPDPATKAVAPPQATPDQQDNMDGVNPNEPPQPQGNNNNDGR